MGGAREGVRGREGREWFEAVTGGGRGELGGRVDADMNQQRGEFVLLVAGAQDEAADKQLAEGRRVFALLREELAPARAAKLAAAITGAPRKVLYEG